MQFTKHADGRITVDCWDSQLLTSFEFLVDCWDSRVVTSLEFLSITEPGFACLVGDRLTITVANGRAVYQEAFRDHEMWRGVLIESEWVPWRNQVDDAGTSRLTWFDCSAGLVCVCGAEIILADDEEKVCDCGRAYRLIARLETRDREG